MMKYIRVMIVFLVCYHASLPNFCCGIRKNTTDIICESTSRAVEGRRHRLQMFFPLMLGISARLAALVPTALMILFGTFVFVALAKKAFLISLAVLYIVLSRKSKKTEEERNAEEDEGYETIEEHIHRGHWPEKHYYKKWHPPKKHTYRHEEWQRPMNPLLLMPYVPIPIPVYYPYYFPNYQHFPPPHLLKG